MRVAATPIVAIVQDTAAESAQEVARLAWRENRSEWGGPVWGRLFSTSGGYAVWIAAMTPGLGSGTAAEFQMEPESSVIGLRMLREAGFLNGLDEVGLWHSHPGYGAWLSHIDEEYFRLLYPQPWKVSVVVDHINQDYGVFIKNGRGIERATAYLYSGSKLGRVPRLDVRGVWRTLRRSQA